MSIRQNIFLSENFSTIAKEAEVQQFYEDQQDLLELTTKKDVLFITGDSNAKLGSQEISGITGKYGLGVQNEAGQRLKEFCQGNTLVIANALFQQCKGQFYMWTSPNGQYQNQIDYIFFAAENGEDLYSQGKQKKKTRTRLWLRSTAPYCGIQAQIEESRENY